jgi:hypothetical protein
MHPCCVLLALPTCSCSRLLPALGSADDHTRAAASTAQGHGLTGFGFHQGSAVPRRSLGARIKAGAGEILVTIFAQPVSRADQQFFIKKATEAAIQYFYLSGEI